MLHILFSILPLICPTTFLHYQYFFNHDFTHATRLTLRYLLLSRPNQSFHHDRAVANPLKPPNSSIGCCLVISDRTWHARLREKRLRGQCPMRRRAERLGKKKKWSKLRGAKRTMTHLAPIKLVAPTIMRADKEDVGTWCRALTRHS